MYTSMTSYTACQQGRRYLIQPACFCLISFWSLKKTWLYPQVFDRRVKFCDTWCLSGRRRTKFSVFGKLHSTPFNRNWFIEWRTKTSWAPPPLIIILSKFVHALSIDHHILQAYRVYLGIDRTSIWMNMDSYIRKAWESIESKWDGLSLLVKNLGIQQIVHFVGILWLIENWIKNC